jgi:hypothetical protein
MGPDRDGGLPINRRGRIRQLESCHNYLLALIDATTAPSALTTHQSQAPGNGDVVKEDAGFSHILGYLEDNINNIRGWHSLWVSGSATRAITVGHVSNAYGAYRLWWGQNGRVSWLTLPREINNPEFLTTQTYHVGPKTHETPWYDAGERHARKLALRLLVETTGCSATETVIVEYAINRSGTYTSLGTITTNGVTTYLFPNSTTPTGTSFQSIRFRVTEARGSTTTLSPDVRQMEFHFEKLLPVRWAHSVIITLNTEVGGASREEAFERIRAAVESATLVEFTFRNRDADDAGNANVFNYYVRAEFAEGQEQTGNDWGGQVALHLVER